MKNQPFEVGFLFAYETSIDEIDAIDKQYPKFNFFHKSKPIFLYQNVLFI